LLTTGGKERMAAYLRTLAISDSERAALSARIADLHKAKTANYMRIVSGGEVPLREGVLRLLDEARDAGLPVAIATTTTAANIEALLQTALGPDALARFAVIGAGDQVLHKKPAPDIYTLVLRDLRLAAEDCVAIEDSANGLNSAKAAGIFTIVTPSYWTQGENFAAADLLLPSLGSVARPITHRAAQLIGSGVLGIREIDRQLTAARMRA
jgi:HAD superfamily hydrolase (TIGR01509 family)